MTAPDRIVVDLPGGRTRGVRRGGAGLAARLRLAQFDPATARLVVELGAPARLIEARVIEDGAAVELELAPTGAADFTRLARAGRFAAVRAGADLSAPAARAGAAQAAASAAIGGEADAVARVEAAVGRALAKVGAPAIARTRPIVVIDPGHGGHDVGAISAWEGRYEKDATLAIARAIASELARRGRVDARLTRVDDRFIELGGRVAIARAAGAGLFISVHADSAPNAAARGATVYTLSEVASDAMAARLAARENKADAVAGLNLKGEEPDAATILYDIAKRGAMNASARFAERMRGAMPAVIRFTGASHRFAGFRVLRTADMPAVLLETGYLSNEEDARLLFSNEGRRAIATGVADAVEAHFAPRIAASAAGVLAAR